jgi:hypothetical protein
MHKSLITKLAAAAVAMTVGAAANASTVPQVLAQEAVGAEATFVIANTLNPTAGIDLATYEVTATEDLLFAEILLQGAGFNSGNDLNALTIEFSVAGSLVSSAPFQFTGSTSPAGALSEGSSAFAPPPISVSAGDMIEFSIFETNADGISDPITLDLLLTTQRPAPIPVPAAGVLMLSLMAAGGFAAHRRRKAAA